MRKVIKKSSLFMVIFFAMNIFSLTGFFDAKSVAITGTAIEQIFAEASQPANIVKKMMSQKAQNKTPPGSTKTKDSSKNLKIVDYMLGVTMVIMFTMMLAVFVLCLGKESEGYFKTIVKYPLKIPWREGIFLLLMMKILFNVRPRAGDIYAYNYAVKKSLC